MRQIKFILLTILFFNCSSGSKNDVATETEKQVNKTEESIQPEKITETQAQTDIFCDTTKFPDFIDNLSKLNSNNFQTDYQDKEAKEFIDHACSNDSLFCGKITKKILAAFKYNDEWTLNLVGYVLDQETGMEETSASFFVLTIYRNNQAWFSDILSDLMGEIKIEMNGFEVKESQVRLWGHVYPYFEADYGKFELTIKNGTGFYEYECHSEH